MTRLILLRHGETSQPDRLHGAESDVPLGERGREQAKAAARWLRDLEPTHVYSSAMKRAVATAEIVAGELAVPTTVVPELHERRMGPLSGMLRSEGLPEHQRIKAEWIAGRLDERGADGESYNEIRDRLNRAFESILNENFGRTIVVVCHGVAIQVFLSSRIKGFSHRDLDRIGLGFLARNELEWDEFGLMPKYLNGVEVAMGGGGRAPT